MQLGTAAPAPGQFERGYLAVTDLPTGAPERLPVVIAEGVREGPTLWVTAAIHGDEVTAMAAAQDLVREGLPERLAGTLVCLPCLNPAGLRRTTRSSYYHDHDPNRYFPEADGDDRARPPRVQEVIDRRVFEHVRESADALLDLHTAQVGSIPFTIRDRVLYGQHRSREDAQRLADELDDLARAAGLPLVNEYAAGEYVEENLQRSTAGAALNTAGIPALTLELGSHSVVEEGRRAAGVAAVYRVMVQQGLLEAVPEDVHRADPALEAPVGYPVRRHVGPHTDTAGIVRHRLAAGDVFAAGDPVADVVAPTGEHRATVETDHEGYVLGRYGGVAVYENDPLYSLAVRDDEDLLAPRDPDEE